MVQVAGGGRDRASGEEACADCAKGEMGYLRRRWSGHPGHSHPSPACGGCPKALPRVALGRGLPWVTALGPVTHLGSSDGVGSVADLGRWTL